jgi:hypothetical protein
LLIDKVLWKGGGSKKMVFTDWHGYKGHVQNDGLEWMALIARVGDQRVPASAKEFSFVAKADGELLLFANDGQVKGNSGKGEMTVTIMGGPAPAAFASSKKPEPASPPRVVPAGMFASLAQMVDSAPSSVLAKMKDSSVKGEGVAEVNDYLSQNVKGKSANLMITVEKSETWDHPPNNFRIKAAEKGSGKSPNIKAFAMWVYFKDDPTAAGQVVYEGSRINVEGVVSRCEVKDNGGLRFNVDLQKSKILTTSTSTSTSPPVVSQPEISLANLPAPGTFSPELKVNANELTSSTWNWKSPDAKFDKEISFEADGKALDVSTKKINGDWRIIGNGILVYRRGEDQRVVWAMTRVSPGNYTGRGLTPSVQNKTSAITKGSPK